MTTPAAPPRRLVALRDVLFVAGVILTIAAAALLAGWAGAAGAAGLILVLFALEMR